MKVSLKIVVPVMLVSGLLWSVLTMMAAIFKPSFRVSHLSQLYGLYDVQIV